MDGGFRNIRKGVEPRLRGTGFLGGEQAQLAFGNPPRLVPGQGPEQRGEAFAFERAAEDVGVAWASHVVGNDSGKLDAHPGSVKPEPRNECGGGARHAPGVEHEHDGDAEGAGAVGGASRRIAGITAVEQPHDPFADAGVGIVGAVVPQRADAFAAHHPCIEVAGGVPGGLSVEGRVDIVRPALEALHLQPASGERTHQRDPRRRLPLPGSGGGKAKCVKCRVHGILPKFWGRGKLPEKGPSPVPAVPLFGPSASSARRLSAFCIAPICDYAQQVGAFSLFSSREEPLREPEGGMLGRGTASLPKGAVPVPPVPASPYSIYFST